MDRKLIRKLINNIYSEAHYIDTQMELRDRKEPDSAIALTQEENTEIMIMLSQADYLKDYLHNSITEIAIEEVNGCEWKTTERHDIERAIRTELAFQKYRKERGL